MYSLPPDHLERVYAGVLGKIIGVYLGRPFEMWSHQRIMKELGYIDFYVNDRLGLPVVVIDDDVSGTFAFVRALEEHADISSEKIGKTWLNNVAETKSIFWWGGRGISTEHTAFYNLKHGIPAPKSGSIEVNGKTVAEQIGAQIFIDGWALVSPGQPDLAVKLAEMAGKVSHDGESVYAAMLWAAMEAEAFLSKDIDHLLDTGLRYIPHDSLIATGIRRVRSWVNEDGDWLKTRQRIDDQYGYHKFHGVCHVVPNHLLMVMSLLYGGHDFSLAMKIVNTCGWDTDCNSGNLGCLVAIMHGMDSFSGEKDWRGPVEDRAIISTVDGGYSVNNAARIAYDVANMGRRLAGKAPLPPPKNGAQFHFSLPGSVQGFRPSAGRVYQDSKGPAGPALCIETSEETEVLTHTSASSELFSPNLRAGYQFCCSPLVYPGQKVRARLVSNSAAQVTLRLKYYDADEKLVSIDGESASMEPTQLLTLDWQLPEIPGSQPVAELGIVVQPSSGPAKVWLQSLKWSGPPQYTIQKPSKRSRYWDLSWVHNCSHVMYGFMDIPIILGSDTGEGMMTTGTKEWTDYKVSVENFIVKLGGPSGIAIRVRGLNRYYALVFTPDKKLALIKAVDEQRHVLKAIPCDWALDEKYSLDLQAEGSRISGRMGDLSLSVEDNQWTGGGMAIVLSSGSVSFGDIRIGPV